MDVENAGYSGKITQHLISVRNLHYSSIEVTGMKASIDDSTS
jgi:hypothetical protein